MASKVGNQHGLDMYCSILGNWLGANFKSSPVTQAKKAV